MVLTFGSICSAPLLLHVFKYFGHMDQVYLILSQLNKSTNRIIKAYEPCFLLECSKKPLICYLYRRRNLKKYLSQPHMRFFEIKIKIHHRKQAINLKTLCVSLRKREMKDIKINRTSVDPLNPYKMCNPLLQLTVVKGRIRKLSEKKKSGKLCDKDQFELNKLMGAEAELQGKNYIRYLNINSIVFGISNDINIVSFLKKTKPELFEYPYLKVTTSSEVEARSDFLADFKVTFCNSMDTDLISPLLMKKRAHRSIQYIIKRAGVFSLNLNLINASSLISYFIIKDEMDFSDFTTTIRNFPNILEDTEVLDMFFSKNSDPIYKWEAFFYEILRNSDLVFAKKLKIINMEFICSTGLLALLETLCGTGFEKVKQVYPDFHGLELYPPIDEDLEREAITLPVRKICRSEDNSMKIFNKISVFLKQDEIYQFDICFQSPGILKCDRILAKDEENYYFGEVFKFSLEQITSIDKISIDTFNGKIAYDALLSEDMTVISVNKMDLLGLKRQIKSFQPSF
ncbi:unnamed protein product [Moneuplotes crassus]|uniref:Uncharacterized protein n=1 Tax=Euplotes crassus TaxID=5936 RepID=A0AAD1UGL6_EUPCR|nr:unnamed protein product [Moneuplotes crassus]